MQSKELACYLGEEEQVIYEEIDPKLYREEDKLKELDHLLIFGLKDSNDPDSMYMHQVLMAEDVHQFIKTMVKEVKDHTEEKHWSIMEKGNIPKGTIILLSVWAMCRKRKITTMKVYEWKARLNFGGHKMVKGVPYNKTYSPMVGWLPVRHFISLSPIFCWLTKQIGFVFAYW